MAEVRIKSNLDSSGFRAGMAGMKKEVKGFGGQLGQMKGIIAGAFGAGAIIALGRSVLQLGSTLSDLATQSGLTTDELQALEIAAIRAGTAPEKIRTVFSKISVVLGQAKSGMKTYVDLFDKIGISQEEVARLDTAGAFELIAKKMAVATQGSVEYGAALEILGTRSGAQLIEVLREVADIGLQGMIDKSKEAGQIMDAELIQKLDELEDKLQLTARQVKVGFAGAFDVLATAIQNASGFLGGLTRKMDLTKGLLPQILKLDLKGGVAGFRSNAEEDAVRAAVRAGDAAQKERLKGEAADRQVAALKVKDEERLDKVRAKQRDKAIKENEAFNKTQTAMLDKEDKAADRIAKKKETAAERIAKLQEKTVSIQAADRLAKIGGSLGGRINPQVRVAEAQAALIKETNAILKGLAKEIGVEVAELGALI